MGPPYVLRAAHAPKDERVPEGTRIGWPCHGALVAISTGEENLVVNDEHGAETDAVFFVSVPGCNVAPF